jgi:hypothetical protein
MRQIVRKHIGKDHREHEHYSGLESPIPIYVPQKVVPRVNMISWVGSDAFYIMFM